MTRWYTGNPPDATLIAGLVTLLSAADPETRDATLAGIDRIRRQAMTGSPADKWLAHLLAQVVAAYYYRVRNGKDRPPSW